MVESNKNTGATGTQPSYAQLQEKLAALEAQLAEKNNRTITFKVAEEKGGISAIGLNNTFPVTLYSQQWMRLMEAALGKPLPEGSPLGTFIKTNEKYLAVKGEPANIQADKLLLRKAESHGVVSHPSEASRAKNKAKTTA